MRATRDPFLEDRRKRTLRALLSVAARSDWSASPSFWTAAIATSSSSRSASVYRIARPKTRTAASRTSLSSRSSSEAHLWFFFLKIVCSQETLLYPSSLSPRGQRSQERVAAISRGHEHNLAVGTTRRRRSKQRVTCIVTKLFRDKSKV